MARIEHVSKPASRLAEQDALHLKLGYVHLVDTLNELEQVFQKDNVLAHMVRTLCAMENTLFEYVTPERR